MTLRMELQKKKVLLVFGASGAIGKRCVEMLNGDNVVVSASRDLREFKSQIQEVEKFSGVIWAQGRNASDSVIEDNGELEEVLQANLLFIIDSLKIILSENKLETGSQLVIVGSVWSSLARPKKMSYIVSKSAISGLTKSLAVDLGVLGIQVNTVSPGPLESKMTRANLSATEIARIESETPIKRLVELEEACRIITGIALGQMSGMSGQEIVIDGGWGIAKLEKN